MNNYSLIIGGIIIGLAIIFGAYLSTSPSADASKNSSTPISTTKEEVIFTEDELANFLSIDRRELEDIIEKDDIERASIGEADFDTYRFIPYAIVSGEHRFLKKEILSWLDYQTHTHPANKKYK